MDVDKLHPQRHIILSAYKSMSMSEIYDSHSGSASAHLANTNRHSLPAYKHRENVDLTRQQRNASQLKSGSRVRRHNHAAGEFGPLCLSLSLNEYPMITYQRVTSGFM